LLLLRDISLSKAHKHRQCVLNVYGKKIRGRQLETTVAIYRRPRKSWPDFTRDICNNRGLSLKDAFRTAEEDDIGGQRWGCHYHRAHQCHHDAEKGGGGDISILLMYDITGQYIV